MERFFAAAEEYIPGLDLNPSRKGVIEWRIVSAKAVIHGIGVGIAQIGRHLAMRNKAASRPVASCATSVNQKQALVPVTDNPAYL